MEVYQEEEREATAASLEAQDSPASQAWMYLPDQQPGTGSGVVDFHKMEMKARWKRRWFWGRGVPP